MPIGVIAAGVTAAATIGGAVISSGAQSSAANQANQAQQSATQAQLQLGRESLAQNQAVYNQNYALASPFIANGLGASNAYMSMLGVSPGAVPANALAPGTAPAAGGGFPSGVQSAPVASQSPIGGGFSAQPNAGSPLNVFADSPAYGTTSLSPGQRAANMGGEPLGSPTAGPQANGDHIATGGVPVGSRLSGTTPGQGTGIGTGTAPGTPAPAPSAANALSPTQAFNNFANSAGMQFQLQQGTNALNNMYAARGMVQSGAAMKGINNYAQQTALNNYFMPYMGMLQGQQNMGAGMASSVMGVGQNFANTAANINAGMGSTLQNGADSAANAALARGAANANMWSGIGSGLGTLASSFSTPSFAPQQSSVGLPTGDGINGGWFYPGIGM